MCMKMNKAQPTLSLSLYGIAVCGQSRTSNNSQRSSTNDNSSVRCVGCIEHDKCSALSENGCWSSLRNPVRKIVSIHPLFRQMEWRCKKDKRGWLHEDISPTIVANEARNSGNVVYEIYETE